MIRLAMRILGGIAGGSDTVDAIDGCFDAIIIGGFLLLPIAAVLWLIFINFR